MRVPRLHPKRDLVVMRLVEGRSLEECLRADGPLPAPRAVEVATALLKALQAAHAAGIVHRDLKPANVMLTDDGQVLLTDFGIAVHETDTRLTAAGGVIGSAEYMAPERLHGTRDQAAGDLFSLGATLYQAVEGISPFRRETPTATIAAVALHEPPPMRHADPVLASLVTALLAKNPEDRPTVDSTLAILHAGTRTMTAAMPMPSRPPQPSTAPATSTETTAAVSRAGRAGRLITGTCFLVPALGVIAFVCSRIAVLRGRDSVFAPSLVASVLVAVLLGLAAMFYRWKGHGRPSYRIVGATFLPVFLPLALIWTVWNALLRLVPNPAGARTGGRRAACRRRRPGRAWRPRPSRGWRVDGPGPPGAVEDGLPLSSSRRSASQCAFIRASAVWTLAHRGYSGSGRLDVWVYRTRKAAMYEGAKPAMACGMHEDEKARLLHRITFAPLRQGALRAPGRVASEAAGGSST
ncbi:serine/threonine protein kinase (plasmid) [Embleya sp. NBC_00896]|nr:serine/threonine protein kinase [Embleya sp. NBC_00896]